MAVVTRENYILHKLHSLTGVVPVGYYMLQHLALNSFSLAGPQKFDAVINFFESIPKHVLLVMEVTMIWIPILFHAVYGVFITGRAKQNYIGTKYNWSENRMYLLQRVSGIVIFLFLSFHVTTTTGKKYFTGDAEQIKYAAMHTYFTSYAYIPLMIYMVGILAASYHFSYGIWNFCVRWGITISDNAQRRVQQFSALMFVAITVMGWAALFGFLIPQHEATPLQTAMRTR